MFVQEQIFRQESSKRQQITNDAFDDAVGLALRSTPPASASASTERNLSYQPDTDNLLQRSSRPSSSSNKSSSRPSSSSSLEKSRRDQQILSHMFVSETLLRKQSERRNDIKNESFDIFMDIMRQRQQESNSLSGTYTAVTSTTNFQQQQEQQPQVVETKKTSSRPPSAASKNWNTDKQTLTRMFIVESFIRKEQESRQTIVVDAFTELLALALSNQYRSTSATDNNNMVPPIISYGFHKSPSRGSSAGSRSSNKPRSARESLAADLVASVIESAQFDSIHHTLMIESLTLKEGKERNEIELELMQSYLNIRDDETDFFNISSNNNNTTTTTTSSTPQQRRIGSAENRSRQDAQTLRQMFVQETFLRREAEDRSSIAQEGLSFAATASVFRFPPSAIAVANVSSHHPTTATTSTETTGKSTPTTANVAMLSEDDLYLRQMYSEATFQHRERETRLETEKEELILRLQLSGEMLMVQQQQEKNSGTNNNNQHHHHKFTPEQDKKALQEIFVSDQLINRETTSRNSIIIDALTEFISFNKVFYQGFQFTSSFFAGVSSSSSSTTNNNNNNSTSSQIDALLAEIKTKEAENRSLIQTRESSTRFNYAVSTNLRPLEMLRKQRERSQKDANLLRQSFVAENMQRREQEQRGNILGSFAQEEGKLFRDAFSTILAITADDEM